MAHYHVVRIKALEGLTVDGPQKVAVLAVRGKDTVDFVSTARWQIGDTVEVTIDGAES